MSKSIRQLRETNARVSAGYARADADSLRAIIADLERQLAACELSRKLIAAEHSQDHEELEKVAGQLAEALQDKAYVEDELKRRNHQHAEAQAELAAILGEKGA